MHDTETIEMPWHQEKYNEVIARTQSAGRADGRLVLGLLASDQFVRPHPNISKALDTVKHALEACGHEVSMAFIAASLTL